MLVSLKDIVGCEDYYIDDTTFQIVSFKQKKYTEGKTLKPHINKDGYIDYKFCVSGKQKNILLHHIIVKLFIDKNFDSRKNDIDHKDHNRTNNSIENLAVVSRSENSRNMSKSRTGKEFNFVNDIGKSLVINEEAQIYYSIDFDKFFVYIEHTNKFKELHIYLNNGKYPCIHYQYNNKQYKFSINKFKKSLNKQ